jgi:hypothetical protein
MTKDDRAKAETVINVPIPIKVVYVAIASIGNDRCPVVTPVAEVRINAKGDNFFGALVEIVRFLTVRHK